jgi:putative membrane protein
VDAYLIVKTVHLICVVAWFAGLFYIFRLFVYHAQKRSEAKVCETLSIMEQKLLFVIMFPASIVVVASGLVLSSLNSTVWFQVWFQTKLVVLTLLFGYQELARKTFHKFRRGEFYLTEKQCRFINEIPTVVLILVVALAIIKPFGK